jgi:Kef-type K+ transport system membrane component KefB
MNLFFILILFALMHALKSFSNGGVAASSGTSLALGYVLLTAYFAGKLFAQIGLPKLTGYIAAGAAVGPPGLGLLDPPIVDSLKLVNGMAIALIALTAGAELELRAMRPLFRSILFITLTGVVGTAVLLSVAVLVSRSWLPFMQDRTLAQAVAIAAVLGTVMVAQSPAVVVALRNELNAEGPVSRTVLGVVVIADLVVILLFAITSASAKAVLGATADIAATLASLAWELLGSLVVGAALGYVLALYLRKVKGGEAMFLLLVTFVIAEIGQRLHFDPLLVALAAGVLIRNLTTEGEQVHHLIEGSALPIYILFFAVAGATLHFGALATIGLPALLFVIVRGAGLLIGTRIGAALARADPAVCRYAGYGLLPQAGLALALSMLFAKTFPEFGADAGALTLTVVALNEIIAPGIYRFALLRSGEAKESQPNPPPPDPVATAET